MASLMNVMIPSTSPFGKADDAVDRLGEDPLGALPDAAEVGPSRSGSSSSMKSVTAALIALPAIPSVWICCSTQLPTFSKIP